MNPYYNDDSTIIYNADCVDVLPQLGGITAVVTDPPYGLEFMGKEWDRGVPGKRFWKEVLNACLPGVPLLSFGGTRTYHRLTSAIEDAGWEIRDCLMWIYGSGFPKSLDVGKAIDKAVGATPAAQLWDGYGTALKPAYEPIILGRKPLDGTVAHNVQEHGTGALWIDEGRVQTKDKLGGGAEKYKQSDKPDGWDRPWRHNLDSQRAHAERIRENVERAQVKGRWPANIIHDGSDEVVELFPQTGGGRKPKQQKRTESHIQFLPNFRLEYTPYEDTFTGGGSAARFFYCAKASKSERNAGVDDMNTHPTVKPQALMRHLITLVTVPENNVILDHFMGSGSTLVAAKTLGLRAIGIEKDARTCEIAVQRIRNAEWRAHVAGSTKAAE